MFQSQTVFNALVSALDPSFTPDDEDIKGVPNKLVQSMFEHKAYDLADTTLDMTLLTAFAEICKKELDVLDESGSSKFRSAVYHSLRQSSKTWKTFSKETHTLKYAVNPSQTANMQALNAYLKKVSAFPRLPDSGFNFMVERGPHGEQNERLGMPTFWSHVEYITESLRKLINAATKEQAKVTLLNRAFFESVWILWYSPDVLESESQLWLDRFNAYMEFREEIIRVNGIKLSLRRELPGKRGSVKISYTSTTPTLEAHFRGGRVK